MVVPEYRAGDTVFPGRPVADVLHASGLELVAKVTEYDRAHLNAGQKAEVAIHAVQGATLPATIKTVAGASRRSDFFGWDSTRMFDVSLQVTGGTANLRPGLTTHVRVTGDPIKKARGIFPVRRSSSRTASRSCSSAAGAPSSRERSRSPIAPRPTSSWPISRSAPKWRCGTRWRTARRAGRAPGRCSQAQARNP